MSLSFLEDPTRFLTCLRVSLVADWEIHYFFAVINKAAIAVQRSMH